MTFFLDFLIISALTPMHFWFVLAVYLENFIEYPQRSGKEKGGNHISVDIIILVMIGQKTLFQL